MTSSKGDPAYELCLLLFWLRLWGSNWKMIYNIYIYICFGLLSVFQAIQWKNSQTSWRLAQVTPPIYANVSHITGQSGITQDYSKILNDNAAVRLNARRINSRFTSTLGRAIAMCRKDKHGTTSRGAMRTLSSRGWASLSFTIILPLSRSIANAHVHTWMHAQASE